MYVFLCVNVGMQYAYVYMYTFMFTRMLEVCVFIYVCVYMCTHLHVCVWGGHRCVCSHMCMHLQTITLFHLFAVFSYRHTVHSFIDITIQNVCFSFSCRTVRSTCCCGTSAWVTNTPGWTSGSAPSLCTPLKPPSLSWAHMLIR